MDILPKIDQSTSDNESSSRKLFVCTFNGCLKEFSKNRKLQNHIRLHTGDRPFACDVPNCFKNYTNSSHLQRHKKTKHENYNEKIMCTNDGCSRELSNKTSLKKHLYRCHNPQRIYPFMCDECDQGFYRKKQLQQHSYLHTGQKPFSCDQCDTKFITIKEKNKHKKIHTKYTCTCGNVCEKWTSLLAHKKTCTFRSFKCSICSKIFSSELNLNMHANTHINKEDRYIYLCPYNDCKRYYFYKKNLTFHINKYHKKILQPKIPCMYDGCDKLVSKMQNYLYHLKTHGERNAPKFPRKPRKDKGLCKKKAIEELCGIKLLNEPVVNEKEITSNNEPLI